MNESKRPISLPEETEPADADVFILDGSEGVRKINCADLKSAVATAFAGAPGTFNLAPLVDGKVPSENLPFTGGLVFVNSVAGNAVPVTAPSAGNFYVISSAGTSQSIAWAVNDWAVYKGASGQWSKISAATLAVLLGGTGATTAAGARLNLGTPSNEEAQSLGHSRASAGGIFSPSSASFTCFTAYNAGGVKFGLSDFSVAIVAQHNKWNSGASASWFKNNQPGAVNNFAIGYTPTTKQVYLNWVNAAGVSAGQNLITLDGANLIDGETYFFCVTCDRDGYATVYVNAVNDRDGNATVVQQDISAKATIDLGLDNINAAAFAGTMDGVLYSLRIFNRLLSLSEIQQMNRTGLPVFADQYAAPASKYNSDFSAGVDGWVISGAGTMTGNNDAVGGVDDCLVIDTAATTSMAGVKMLAAARKAGQRAKLTYSIYIPVTNVTGVTIVPRNSVPTNCGFAVNTPTKGVWATFTEEIVLTADFAGIRFQIFTAGGASGIITAGDKFYLKNVSLEFTGCIADWDLESANPALSLTVPDRAGLYDAYLLSNVAQTKAVTQLNAKAVTVGGGATLKKVLSATASLNFPSIAANGQAELTMTVTGAVVGDAVAVGYPAAPEVGLQVTARVSAADTVTFRATHNLATALDPAASTYRATVYQF